MEPVEKYYKDKDIEADDEKYIIKDDDLSIDKEDKSLKDELKLNIGKTVLKTLT